MQLIQITLSFPTFCKLVQNLEPRRKYQVLILRAMCVPQSRETCERQRRKALLSRQQSRSGQFTHKQLPSLKLGSFLHCRFASPSCPRYGIVASFFRICPGQKGSKGTKEKLPSEERGRKNQLPPLLLLKIKRLVLVAVMTSQPS